MKNNSQDEAAPMGPPETVKDRFYATYFLFYALGVVSLVPSNFYPTATNYWLYKFRDPANETYSNENRTKLQANFFSTYSIVSGVSMVVFLILALIFGGRFSTIKKLIGSLCGVVLMFVLTVIFVAIDTDSWQMGFFVVTLIIGFFVMGCCSVFLVAIFEAMPRFPPHYMVGILTGQAICGILGSVAQIFSVAVGAKGASTGLIYFLIGTGFVVLVLIVLILIFLKSDFFRWYLYRKIEPKAGEEVKVTRQQLFSVLYKVRYYLLSMVISLGTTSMISPGITALVTSLDEGNGNRWNDDFFVPVITFFLYNVADYIGREFATKFRRPKNGIILLVLSIVRVSFIPLIMLCNAQPRSRLPVVFNDTDYSILILFSGVSHGFLLNLNVYFIPSVTDNLQERKLAMVLIMLVMLIALGAFSFLSAALVNSL